MLNYLKYAPFASVIFVVTIIISLYSLFFDHKLIDSFILKPKDIFSKKRFYAVITSGFIHADLSHLFKYVYFFLFCLLS